MGGGRQRWEVVGGAEKGSILVRDGRATASQELADRLATGALVEELELAGERLHYQKLRGAGPESGWVSVSLKDKALLVRAVPAPEETSASSPSPEDSTSPSQASELPAAADATRQELKELKDGDYFVTLGVIFKKPGTDPETQKFIKLTRKVGAVVHTTGKVWKSPSGGFWVELDTSSGDTGAGEKPGYVMIDANGFGTPGPCLQKADLQAGQPIVLQAAKPAEAKPWDGSDSDKEFLVLRKTSVAEVKVVLSMLFGLRKEAVRLSDSSGKVLKEDVSVEGAGFQDGSRVNFEYADEKPLNLTVMSPLEEGVKLVDLAAKDNWSVGQVKNLLCSLTGLKSASMIMARGKMGTRVGEDASLNESDLVVDHGYKEGDEIAFIYMGDPASDLEAFLARK